MAGKDDKGPQKPKGKTALQRRQATRDSLTESANKAYRPVTPRPPPPKPPVKK